VKPIITAGNIPLAKKFNTTVFESFALLSKNDKPFLITDSFSFSFIVRRLGAEILGSERVFRGIGGMDAGFSLHGRTCRAL